MHGSQVQDKLARSLGTSHHSAKKIKEAVNWDDAIENIAPPAKCYLYGLKF